jgi:hypothetical protein
MIGINRGKEGGRKSRGEVMFNGGVGVEEGEDEFSVGPVREILVEEGAEFRVFHDVTDATEEFMLLIDVTTEKFSRGEGGGEGGNERQRGNEGGRGNERGRGGHEEYNI